MLKIIGHRAARGLAPENTLAAIKLAVEYGVHEIEIDVRVTKDSVPVLHHDALLRDEWGQPLRELAIAKHTLAQLRRARRDLTTLEEAIKTVKRRIPLLIELKPRVPIEPVVNLLKTYLAKGWQPSDFLLGSFSQRTLMALHQALPEMETVVIGRVWGVWATRRARQLGTKRISMWQYGLWWGFIRSLARSGYRLCAYALNDSPKAKRWARWGLYGAITDYPDRFKRKKS